MVPAGKEQQHQDNQHDTDTCGPDAPDVGLAHHRLDDGIEEQHHTDEQDEGEIPHVEEVVQILIRFHDDGARGRIPRKAVLHQGVDEEGEEQDEEGHGGTDKTHAAARADVLVVHIIHNIQDAEDAGKEEHGETEDEHPRIEQGVETMAGIGPAADDGSAELGEAGFLDDEVGTLEEGSYGTAEEQRAEDTVDDEEPLEGLRAKQVAQLVLELIAHRL